MDQIIGLVLFYYNLIDKSGSDNSRRSIDSSNSLFTSFVGSFEYSTMISNKISSIQQSAEEEENEQQKEVEEEISRRIKSNRLE